jgi:hypothetical protein
MATNSLDHLAGSLADALAGGPAPQTLPSHRDLTLATAALIRRHGAAEALAILRLTLGAVAGYHDTRTVFTVWAVDRLLRAGLGCTELLWHPLTCGGAEAAWWDSETLAGVEAARRFVVPTQFRAGDPVPSEPRAEFAVAS